MVAAVVFASVTAWSGVAAAEGPDEPREARPGENMATAGGLAVFCSSVPLVTGGVLFAHQGGIVSGRELSPYFLVPGGASFTAGVVLVAVGLARRGGDGDAASSGAVQVMVAPRQVGVSGGF